MVTANKERYEHSVKEPFAVFVGEMLRRMGQEGTVLAVAPNDCILRINRDMRFSKDKTPYNTYCTAFLSKSGRKDKSIPGFFFRFSPSEVGIMGGCYAPSTEQRIAVQRCIATNLHAFRRIVEEKTFCKYFGNVRGEEQKRLPVEFADAQQQEPLIARKQWYCTASLPSSNLTKNTLPDKLMEYWRAMHPFNSFLLEPVISG